MFPLLPFHWMWRLWLRRINCLVLKNLVTNKIYRVLVQPQTHPLFGQLFARPARMVGAVQICFWMRHQAEQASTWIADPCNGMHRSIRIEREFLRWGYICRITVFKRCEMFALDPFQHRWIFHHKLPFPMADRQIDTGEAAGKDTGRLLIHLQVY